MKASEGDTASGAPASGWLLWMPWAMTGCFALLCVALIAIGHRLREQAVVMQQRLAGQVSDQAELQRQLAQWQATADTRTSNYEHRLVQTEQRAAQRIQDLQRQSGILSNQFLREQAALRGELAVIRDRADALTREKQVLEEALGGSALLNQQRLGSARIAVLRPTADGPARAIGAAVWLPTDRRGLLVLESLPPLHASQDYQLWLADPNAPAPVSGGVFRPDPAGAVRLEFTSTQAAQVDRFWVTLEPKGGALRPTGKTHLGGP